MRSVVSRPVESTSLPSAEKRHPSRRTDGRRLRAAACRVRHLDEVNLARVGLAALAQRRRSLPSGEKSARDQAVGDELSPGLSCAVGRFFRIRSFGNMHLQHVELLLRRSLASQSLQGRGAECRSRRACSEYSRQRRLAIRRERRRDDPVPA